MELEEGDSVEALKELVQKHDLTYEFSDDNRWYQAGRRSLGTLQSMAKRLFRAGLVTVADVTNIWNAEAVRKSRDPRQFLWEEGWVASWLVPSTD